MKPALSPRRGLTRAALSCLPLWSAALLTLLMFFSATDVSAQVTCTTQGGYCKPQDDAECGVDYTQDDGVSGCTIPTPVCCIPKTCSGRGGLCQQTATCGNLRSLGSAPGCPSCCEPPPYTAQLCSQKGGNVCRHDLSCPAGSTPLGASTDCTMCCATATSPTCNDNGVCASDEGCNCSDCANAAKCSGGPETTSDYKVEFVHADALGSVRMVTDSAGAVVSRTDYYPYGAEIGGNGRSDELGYTPVSTLSERFTGKERDAESGLDYFGARYYATILGRFASPDPSFTFKDLIPEPQLWNRYAYVGNQPVSYIDPDGKERAEQLLDHDIKDLASGKISAKEYNSRLQARGAGAIAGLATVAGGWILANGRALVLAAYYAYNTPSGRDAVNEVAETVSDAPSGSLGRASMSAAEHTAASVADKLDRYLLKLDHPKGGDKAAFFKDVLGITQENASVLARQLNFDASKAVFDKSNVQGSLFNQFITVTGANGVTARIKATWIVKLDGAVEFVTAVPR